MSSPARFPTQEELEEVFALAGILLQSIANGDARSYLQVTEDLAIVTDPWLSMSAPPGDPVLLSLQHAVDRAKEKRKAWRARGSAPSS